VPLLAVVALQRHLVVDASDDALAVPSRLLPANDDVVAVVDVVLDHRLAAHLEGVVLGAGEQRVEVEALVVGDRLDRGAGGDGTEQRQAVRRPLVIDQLDGPRREALAFDQPLLLQRLQMTHDAVGRADLETQPDLANRRAVAARLDLLLDEVVDLALPFRQLAEVRHFPPLVQKDSLKVTPPAALAEAIRSMATGRLSHRRLLI